MSSSCGETQVWLPTLPPDFLGLTGVTWIEGDPTLDTQLTLSEPFPPSLQRLLLSSIRRTGHFMYTDKVLGSLGITCSNGRLVYVLAFAQLSDSMHKRPRCSEPNSSYDVCNVYAPTGN